MTGMVSRFKALTYGVVALALGGLAYAVGVGSLLGQRAEAGILAASQFTYDPPAPLSLVSVPTVGVALAVLFVLTWLVHSFTRGLSFTVFALAAIAASQVLKQEVLSRPALFDLDAPNTFPSGHMTVFAVLAGGLIWASSPRWRGLAALLGAGAMGTVAWQLLEYGWHRPSDLLGALALGLLAVVFAVLTRLPRGARTIRVIGSVASAINKLIGVLMALVGFTLVLGGAVMAVLSVTNDSDQLMLAAVQAAIIGVASLIARAQMTLAG